MTGASARLQRQRDDVNRRLADVETRLIEIRATRGEWTDEEHDPEGFAVIGEWSRAEGRRQELGVELREIDLAEARVGAGTYGICERCGEPIPDAQLRLRPARVLCVTCTDR